ncbi:DUF421 domain-containing protein [Roseicella aerolata]|uniref:DUF421 domain-containing protein n=1 Tax=Roseicella aerolata TaxID=2883479 RepID=A0A9X1IDV4_9PROT|nr:YetF domain-containing protein [Roseicella aerolata]MCB4822672.1 DUF421 domain-containing protein [Roseicella aerolata]
MEAVMEELGRLATWLFGAGSDTPTLPQMAARAVLVYLAALVMVRWGEKRFMGKNTAFDVILGVILGSVVSRAVNSTADIAPTLAAGFVLVAMHWAFASLAFRSDRFGTLVKGRTRVLVEDGRIDWEQMRRSHMSRDDLLGALRAEGVRDPEQVAEARLERSGKVSVIEAKDGPKILGAELADGTLTVRIRLE